MSGIWSNQTYLLLIAAGVAVIGVIIYFLLKKRGLSLPGFGGITRLLQGSGNQVLVTYCQTGKIQMGNLPIFDAKVIMNNKKKEAVFLDPRAQVENPKGQLELSVADNSAIPYYFGTGFNRVEMAKQFKAVRTQLAENQRAKARLFVEAENNKDKVFSAAATLIIVGAAVLVFIVVIGVVMKFVH
jgi:hypothetical protein